MSKKMVPSSNVSKEESKQSRIGKVLLPLILASTSHGLPSVFRTEKVFIKIMWIILFLISSGYGFYMLKTAVLGFLNYDVIVKIRIINELPTEFPTLTFFFNDNKNNNSFKFKDRLIRCSFDGNNCSFNDFEDITYPKTNFRYFKFNSGNNVGGQKIGLKKSKLAGKINGFTALIFIGFPGDFDLIYGFSIYIHNHTHNVIAEEPIEISPGISISLKVKRMFSTKLESPYSDCKAKLLYPDDYDSIIYKYMLNTSSYNYRQKDCMDLCLAKYLINSCNKTVDLDYTWSLYLKNNNDQKFKDCINKKVQNFFNNNDVQKDCSTFCPLECDTFYFQIENSFSQFPSLNEAQTLLNESSIRSLYPSGYNITYEDLKNSFTSISVYYDDLSYTAITEDAKMSQVDLVSNLGGLLGLFIGLSFLSFGEILEAFFEIVFILFEKKKLINPS